MYPDNIGMPQFRKTAGLAHEHVHNRGNWLLKRLVSWNHVFAIPEAIIGVKALFDDDRASQNVVGCAVGYAETTSAQLIGNSKVIPR